MNPTGILLFLGVGLRRNKTSPHLHDYLTVVLLVHLEFLSLTTPFFILCPARIRPSAAIERSRPVCLIGCALWSPLALVSHRWRRWRTVMISFRSEGDPCKHHDRWSTNAGTRTPCISDRVADPSDAIKTTTTATAHCFIARDTVRLPVRQAGGHGSAAMCVAAFTFSAAIHFVS